MRETRKSGEKLLSMPGDLAPMPDTPHRPEAAQIKESHKAYSPTESKKERRLRKNEVAQRRNGKEESARH